MQLGAVVVAERCGDTALRVPAVGRGDRSLREEQHVGLVGRRRVPHTSRPLLRLRQPAAPLSDLASEVFSSKSITCREVYMVSDPKAKTSTPFHAVLAVVLQVRDGRLQVLLWERALDPFRGSWSLPGGTLAEGETLEQSIRRHLETKVDVRELSHLEQLETLSGPGRHPERWELATAYLGLVPSDVDPGVPDDTRWFPVDELPQQLAFDHGPIVLAGRERLRAKLSYTNVGFALAPGRVHDLGATRPLPRGARPRRVGDEPPARAAAPPPARPDRAAAASPARPAAARRRSSASAAASSRSRISSRCCVRRADLSTSRGWHAPTRVRLCAKAVGLGDAARCARHEHSTQLDEFKRGAAARGRA